MPLLSTAITGFPNVAFFAQTYVTKDDNPNSSALPTFQKDVTTRQLHQLTFKVVSLARAMDLSFYSEGLWSVVGKAASRHDRPIGSDAVL